VRAPPRDVTNDDVLAAARDGWGLEIATIEYAPLGAGSYHWLARAADGTMRFVTVDDLDSKTWLGDRREPSFDGLRDAFTTATTLREHELEFVIAPLQSLDGEPLRRLDGRYTIAIFPFVEGESGDWGLHDPALVPDVIRMLATLHARTPAVEGVASRTGVALPGREHLERALGELDESWHGGPLSEQARAAVAAGASQLAELLELADRLASSISRHEVVTHGEPHAANVMRTTNGLALVDWDTVALAPPERDLWLVTQSHGSATDLYTELTGTPVDESALDFFRLLWELKDWAEYLNLLRAPHHDTVDTMRACASLTRISEVHAEWL
jgi:spectinomycin phosphotransferase